MLLQAITIDDRAYEVEKAGASFINTYVFPDGCLPSIEVIFRCVARRTDMQALALEDLTPHYAETLRRWRDNFMRNVKRAEELGYDRRFQRLWTLYLSWCEAGFAERRIGDVLLLLAKPRFGVGGFGWGRGFFGYRGLRWGRGRRTPPRPADHLDARGIATVHLAGSSLGAWIALELARLGRARSVTSLCAAGFWSRPLLGDGELPRKPGPVLARALLPIMGPLLRTRRGRRVVLGMNMAHPERVTHAEALDIVRAYATAPGYPATNLAMRRTSFQGAEGIDVPVTLAWGEHDRLVRPPLVPPEGWRTLLLPDCGHLPEWGRPGVLVAVFPPTPTRT